MNLKKLEGLLYKYTEEELYYKKYYESKKNKDAYKKFMENMDLEYIKNNKIIIPETIDLVKPLEVITFENIYFTENNTFASEELNDIIIEKHKRYLPEFTHRHTFFEMVYVFSGVCTQKIEGKFLEMKSGDICILAPEVNHSICVFDDSIVINVQIKKTTFNESFFQLLTDNNVLSSFFIKILNTKSYNNYILFHTANDENLRSLLLNMINENMKKEKYSNKIVNNMLMMFFGYLLRRYENHVELPQYIKSEVDKIVEILNYIQENFKEVTLENVAEKFNFSLPYLSKIIKKFTGETYTEIVQKIKMNKACTILVNTNCSINDICYMVGYVNQEHFIRVFKKCFGMSPTQYRKKYS